ncbi:MAG: hypothetical protein HY896_08215 [Deltaproteobacteria bacterium]|nr:hypothetical protein [Deltaproteobacteria bacterium]
MKKQTLMALLILIWGIVVLPGCFFHPGHWDHHHDDGRRDWNHDRQGDRDRHDRR